MQPFILTRTLVIRTQRKLKQLFDVTHRSWLNFSCSEVINWWKAEIQWFIDFCECRDLYRIDGEPMGFECKNFQGYTTLKLFDEIQHMMEKEVGNFYCTNYVSFQRKWTSSISCIKCVKLRTLRSRGGGQLSIPRISFAVVSLNQLGVRNSRNEFVQGSLRRRVSWN